jgi:hypothetical protein
MSNQIAILIFIALVFAATVWLTIKRQKVRKKQHELLRELNEVIVAIPAEDKLSPSELISVRSLTNIAADYAAYVQGSSGSDSPHARIVEDMLRVYMARVREIIQKYTAKQERIDKVKRIPPVTVPEPVVLPPVFPTIEDVVAHPEGYVPFQENNHRPTGRVKVNSVADALSHLDKVFGPN